MARGRKALQVMEEPAGGAGDEPAHLAQETLLEEPAPGARPRGIPSAITYASPDGVPAPEHDLSDPDLPFWLALNRIKGIGPARFRLLLDAFGTAEGAWRGSVAGWQAAGLDSRTASAFEQQRRKIVPEAELERLVRLRIGVVRIVDEGYPRLLREIALPPPLIYVRGRLLP